MIESIYTTMYPEYGIYSTQAANTTYKPTAYPCVLHGDDIFFSTACCIITIIGMIGNSLVLYAFFPNKRTPRHSYEILIWYLSIVDLTACIIAPHDIYQILTCSFHWPFGILGCKTFNAIYYMSINMSIFILLIICMDRYRCITSPFKRKLTPFQIQIAVCFGFILSLALQWYQFYLHELEKSSNGTIKCTIDKTRLLYTLPRSITIIIRDLLFIVVFTVSTYCINQSLKKRQDRSLVYKHSKKQKKNNQKILKMLLVMGVAFLLLLLPYDMFDCAMLISRMLPKRFMLNNRAPIVGYLDIAFSLLQMMSNAINCFIYAKMHRKFKRTIQKIFESKQHFTALSQRKLFKLTLTSRMESSTD